MAPVPVLSAEQGDQLAALLCRIRDRGCGTAEIAVAREHLGALLGAYRRARVSVAAIAVAARVPRDVIDRELARAGHTRARPPLAPVFHADIEAFLAHTGWSVSYTRRCRAVMRGFVRAYPLPYRQITPRMVTAYLAGSPTGPADVMAEAFVRRWLLWCRRQEEAAFPAGKTLPAPAAGRLRSEHASGDAAGLVSVVRADGWPESVIGAAAGLDADATWEMTGEATPDGIHRARGILAPFCDALPADDVPETDSLPGAVRAYARAVYGTGLGWTLLRVLLDDQWPLGTLSAAVGADDRTVDHHTRGVSRGSRRRIRAAFGIPDLRATGRQLTAAETTALTAAYQNTIASPPDDRAIAQTAHAALTNLLITHRRHGVAVTDLAQSLQVTPGTVCHHYATAVYTVPSPPGRARSRPGRPAIGTPGTTAPHPGLPAALLAHATGMPHALAVITDGTLITWSGLHAAATALAGRGPRMPGGLLVPIPVGDDPATIIDLAAVSIAGGVPLPITTDLPAPAHRTVALADRPHHCGAWLATGSDHDGTWRITVTGGEPPTHPRVADALRLPGPGHTGLIGLPLSDHRAAETVVRALARGTTLLLLDPHAPTDAVTDAIAAHRPTWALLSAGHLTGLAGQPAVHPLLTRMDTIITTSPASPAYAHLAGVLGPGRLLRWYAPPAHDGALFDGTATHGTPITGVRLRITGRHRVSGIGVVQGRTPGLNRHDAIPPCPGRHRSPWASSGDTGSLTDHGALILTPTIARHHRW
ncbi:class I adenylate-forming enzyme family protein [Catenuloplanes japonicus]|uniref:hypothetical protein n=1 Tax=Catenuloplanes japonicus TaxID=33876 RepID=UPI000527CA48|nr:hypothetical protein [Catenuloplanes japonicus]